MSQHGSHCEIESVSVRREKPGSCTAHRCEARDSAKGSSFLHKGVNEPLAANHVKTMALWIQEHIIRITARVERTQQAPIIHLKHPNLCRVTEHSEHVSRIIQCEWEIGAQGPGRPTRNL